MFVPAEHLFGKKLDNGWSVTKKIEKLPQATGGKFSFSYIVERDNKKAFLKALDYTAAFLHPNTADALQKMTEAYNHEKNLCFLCGRRNLSRIVRAIDAGAIQVDPSIPYTKVEYLIFELAKGDVRKQLNEFKRFDYAWALRTLHQVAVGVNQLHSVGIAHQDLKPSNVLVFYKEGSKIADLGCASFKDIPSPRDAFYYAGDPSYAPPELLYHHINPDWNKRRLSCDVYSMGSLIVFFFTRSGMTGLLDANLENKFNWKNWKGEYKIILPYLQHSFYQALELFASSVDIELQADLKKIVSELCHPDPEQRGHPLDKIGYHNPFSLQRYISKLDLLAKRAEYGLLRAK